MLEVSRFMKTRVSLDKFAHSMAGKYSTSVQQKIQLEEELDLKLGFNKYDHGQPRIGWLFNMTTVRQFIMIILFIMINTKFHHYVRLCWKTRKIFVEGQP